MTPQELKNSILQWAIQGKLVEQRPEEGTAEELYQQIQAEKQRLIKEGKIKKEKPLPEIAEEEKPFKIPESWKWVRLGEIGYTNIGLTYKPTNIANDGIIVLRSNNIYNNRMDYSDIVKVQMNIPKSKMCYKGDILICVRNGSKKLVGKSAIIDQNGMSFGAFMAVFRSMCNNYVFQVIASAYFKNSLLRETGTTTINQITQDMLKTAFIPLPPLAEQKRIVAKIEELLPYIDRYEQAWNRLEELNKRFPVDMQKSLLQWAIQGKLVERRAEEGSAEELYQQIQAEKQRLLKEGKIKKEKPLPEIAEDEKPFEIPESWKWVRLESISSKLTDGSHNPPPNSGQGYPVISAKNIKNGLIIFDNVDRFTDKEGFEKENLRTQITKNDIIMGIIGASIGNIAIYTYETPVIAQRSIAIIKTLIDTYFSVILLKSPLIQKYLSISTAGSAQGGVYLKSLKSLLLPLPPLAEQKRIVAKLEELLPLCQRLQKRMTD